MPERLNMWQWIAKRLTTEFWSRWIAAHLWTEVVYWVLSRAWGDAHEDGRDAGDISIRQIRNRWHVKMYPATRVNFDGDFNDRTE